MKLSKDQLLELVRQDASQMTLQQKIRLLVLLSMPAMLSQLSTVIMQFIDAAMLGHLGTRETAAVGVVSTTIWLFGGLSSGIATGFYVQVAHKVGANDYKRARSIIRQGISCGLVFSFVLASIGLAIAPHLPHWLGAAEAICKDGTTYFSIVALSIPLLLMNSLAAGSLRCSGNIKIPSILNVVLCTLDVVFNYIFIFVCGFGVAGAAWGTFTAFAITMSLMMYFLVIRDKNLRFSLDMKQKFKPHWDTLRTVLKIGTPISLERGAMCSAQVAISGIIAPMGSVAIAANTFAVELEGLCYMPGYGVAEAATTLVGQSLGAKRKDLMKSFAWLSAGLGISVMALMGAIMWLFAPEMMTIVSTDASVIKLGAEVLRIEAWAEPGFAAAIVIFSVFVGAGKTMMASAMNLASIWGIRFTLSLLLAPIYGLHGVWMAMAIELSARGLMFIGKLLFEKWK